MYQQTPKNILIQEELEKRILHGLACEWDSALEVLESFHRTRLHRPLFSLGDMNGRWGSWDGKRNEICLSRDLVLNHSWDAVKEILLHEMAHQFAEQVLAGQNETPHGRKFKKACFLLRANPSASGSYTPLDKRIETASHNPEDKILLKIKKLMSLAQSQNQHEAESAMSKAHELIRKYNVDLLSQDKNRRFESISVGSAALRHFREEYHLSNLLQKYYFVYGIWVPTYVLEKGKMGRVLEITGTVQNLRIAGYIYDFIKNYIDVQWRKYNKSKGLNRYRKTDFSVGIIEGFRSKLEIQTKRNKDTGNKETSDQYSIVNIRDPLLQKHFDYKYPHTANVKGRVVNNDRNILRDGIGIGKELVIHRGISTRGMDKKLLTGSN